MVAPNAGTVGQLRGPTAGIAASREQSHGQLRSSATGLQVIPYAEPDVGTPHVRDGAHVRSSRKTRPVRCPVGGRHTDSSRSSRHRPGAGGDMGEQ